MDVVVTSAGYFELLFLLLLSFLYILLLHLLSCLYYLLFPWCFAFPVLGFSVYMWNFYLRF